jgi:SPP1 family predicted phage head-tail adaptor
MRAGHLDRRVRLERQAGTARDPVGAEVEAWQPVATDWMAIVPLEGRELETARQQFATVTHRLEMRHRAGVTPKMRAVHGTRVFDIEAVVNVGEQNREMRLLVVERGV